MVRAMNDTTWSYLETPVTPPTRAQRRLAYLLVALWSLIIATGLCWLTVYASSPGEASSAPKQREVSVESGSRYALYVFLHPRCPCSAATVSELARLMARCEARVAATAYFVRPQYEEAGWERGKLWDAAAAIPGVAVLCDVGGQVADQYDARTSGDVMLYDPAGALCFHGGITSARGHEGDNLGHSAVLDIALRGTSHVDCSPVFGCPLRARD
jgi:hypothetical protein